MFLGFILKRKPETALWSAVQEAEARGLRWGHQLHRRPLLVHELTEGCRQRPPRTPAHGKYFYPRFMEEETEAQRHQGTCPAAHSWRVALLSQTLAIRLEPGTPTLYQPQRGLPGSGTGQAPAPWLEGMEATQEPPYQHRAEHVTSQDPGLSSIQRGAHPLCSSGNRKFLPSPNYTSSEQTECSLSM